jgi:hypothetical protein
MSSTRAREEKLVIVRRALRTAGRYGIHSCTLRRLGVGNPSQRMNDLRGREGWVIDSHREMLLPDGVPGVRYVMVSEPSTTISTDIVVTEAGDGQLSFEAAA